MKVWSGGLDQPHDVIVVGTGAGGLTAALTASRAGATVAVLDKAPYVGGTTAVSGGMVWIPSNLRMQELGIADSDDDALRYLQRVAGGRTPINQLRMLIESGRSMQAFVERESSLRFSTLAGFPDYHPEWDGAHGGGRSMEADLFDASVMGDLFTALRPDHRLPFTMAEYEEWRIFTRFPWEDLQRRADQGYVARGRALVAPLLHACVEAGVTVVTDLAVQRLIGDAATGVVGVRTSVGDMRCDGVILACGGFEWNRDMCAQFLAGEVRGSCSPPHNTGDGIRMAAALGAKLGNMTEAWWGPMVQLPEDVTDGAPTSTLLRFERTGPHSIMVDRHGRRFLNEAHNYNDVTKVFHAFDPRDYGPVHLPVHLIFDRRHLEEYGFLSHRAGQATPGWLIEAPTIGELARRLGIDATELETTVSRFNTHAERGEDPDWHRGENAYDRYWGDLQAPHPALGPVATAPFYAIEVFSGAIGTKGGVATNAKGQVVNVWDEAISGLFATGNTTAHPMGVGYAGAGSTLGPAMTVGWLAAHTLCGAKV